MKLSSITTLALLAIFSLWLGACSDDQPTHNNRPPANNAFDTSPDDRADTGHDNKDAQLPDDVTSPTDTDRRPSDGGGGDWDWDSGPETPGEFRLTAVIPPTGPTTGDTRVQITGDGFQPGTRVFFGSLEVPVRLSGHQTLIGRTPPSAGPGPVLVRAIAPDGTTQHLNDGFSYLTALRIDSLTPTSLPTSGGVEIEIHGAGFTEPMGVSFSGKDASRVQIIDDSLLRVVAPAHPRGPATLRLTTTTETIERPKAVTYYTPLRIDRVSPTSGQLSGGQTVTIHGQGFTSQTRVSFAEKLATVQSVDAAAGTLRVTTPPATAAGLVDIRLQNEHETYRLENAYLYRANNTFSLRAAHPNLGPTTGGTEVWLVGHGFDAPNLSILFGTKSATIISASADHALVRTPPATNSGPVDIIVRTNTTELGRLTDEFTYQDVVEITDVSPAQGPTAGNQTVTITGRGFDTATRVLFGQLPAAFEIVSDTKIKATTPQHGAARVDVKIITDSGTEAVRTDAFQFLAPLTIWGFSPTRGALAGGTYVSARGTGFSDSLEVKIDGRAASDIRRIDDNNISFRTPPRTRAGSTNVQFTTGDQQADGPYPFVYFNPIDTFGGASGSEVSGAVNISVLSMGGSPVPNAFVMLSTRSETPYQGLTDANGQLTLSGPDVLGAQTVTATAAGHSSATVQAVDAENITLFISPLDGEGGGSPMDPPPYGTISGTIRSVGKRAENGDFDTTFDRSIVQTTQRDMQSPAVYPGTSATVGDNAHYEIRSRTGDVALIGLCGIYNEETDTFKAEFMAIKRFMNITNGQHYHVDLECDIPLDQTATVKLINPIYAPTGPNNNIVNVFWDFGFEGVYRSPTRARGLESILQIPGQPKKTAAIADMSFIFNGGSYTSTYSPYTQTTKTGINDLSQIIALPPLLDVPQLVSPYSGGTIMDNLIRFRASGPYYPDFYWVILRNMDNLPVWQFVLPGTETTVTLPDFPDFSHLPPEQRPIPNYEGPLYLIVYGVRIPNFSYDRFSYNDLSSERWEAFSAASWIVYLIP